MICFSRRAGTITATSSSLNKSGSFAVFAILPVHQSNQSIHPTIPQTIPRKYWDILLGFFHCDTHTCTYIQEHCRLVPFHTCNGNTGIDGARDSRADGGNAILMDDNNN